MTAQLYRMSDDPAAPSRSAIPVSPVDAKRFNTPELGFGIFTTVNAFNGARRKENLIRINAWAVDMDTGPKTQQQRTLLSSPLVPSMIVETKRGYQAWWGARDGNQEHWNAIVLERLVPFFGADKNARDLCRLLRMPGYLHLKDPADPFRCRIVHRHEVLYTERQIAQAFAWVPDKATQRAAHDSARRAAAAELNSDPGESLWDAIYRLDCGEGLMRLSGHWAVQGESYKLRPTQRGRFNLFVNGKGCSVFVDEHKRIGSLSGGGPTLAQWLKWYGHDWKTVIAVLKEVFPKLAEIDKQRRAA